MAREVFCGVVNHIGTQRHLLAIPMAALIEAVHAATEFLQVQLKGRKTGNARVMEEALEKPP